MGRAGVELFIVENVLMNWRQHFKLLFHFLRIKMIPRILTELVPELAHDCILQRRQNKRINEGSAELNEVLTTSKKVSSTINQPSIYTARPRALN